MFGKPRGGPGPADYALPTTIGFNSHDIRKPRLPQYSIGSYYKKRPPKFIGPGPGAYELNPQSIYERSPQYTMRPKTAIITERLLRN